MVGTCEWDNPETRLMLHFRAGLVLGIGAGGSMVGAVDAGKIGEFIQFVYHQLKNHDFHFLDMIEPLAFDNLTRLSVWAVETGRAVEEIVENVGETVDESVEALAKAIRGLGEGWVERGTSKREAIALGLRILDSPEQLKFTTPEAKGILLHTLCKTFFESNEEAQEHAIIKILEHVQSQREYQKVCEHLNASGEKQVFESGHAKLTNILDGVQSFQHQKMIKKWHNQAIKAWEKDWTMAFHETSKKDAAVETNTLV